MKRSIVALSATAFLSLALFGCAGPGTKADTPATSSPETKVEQSTSAPDTKVEPEPEPETEPEPAAASDGGVGAAAEKYGLDLAGGNEWVPMSSETPLSSAELGELYNKNIKLYVAGTMTYDQIVEVFGTDPNKFNAACCPDTLTFSWISSESSARYVSVMFQQDENGAWTIWCTSKTNI